MTGSSSRILPKDEHGEVDASLPSDSISANAAVLFEEKEEALQCIHELATSREDNDYRANDQALESLRTILDKYLEIPSLLDHHIVHLVTALTDAATSLLPATMLNEEESTLGSIEAQDCSSGHIALHWFWDTPLPRILSAIYSLSKVRGRKRVQKFLPHQVETVEPVLNCLVLLDSLVREKDLVDVPCNSKSGVFGGPKLWESTYTMWNWMEILGKVPFDCKVVMEASRVTELLRLATTHLSETGPTREMAASCLARWLTRPDLEQSMFQRSFQQWSLEVLTANLGEGERPIHLGQEADRAELCLPDIKECTVFTTMGILQTLVTILKISTAERKKVLASVEPYWVIIENISTSKRRPSNVLLRKYLIKWWTRLGVLYLPPRIASWRYQRGRRSLNENLQRQLQKTLEEREQSENASENAKRYDSPSELKYNDSPDYFFLVPDQVEVAIGHVLAGLEDSSTVIRWSAAKGVGRITSRLPAICAEDVIDAIMLFFDDMENDNDWHGACLTLAELSRRGLLLPHRLKDVIPKIVKAIHYDVPRRQASVGANVRDAACYTYWALARAYSPQILKPFVPELGQSIVVAFLFDREVNCRRAASAAFQEMVGRQGAQNFKNGISILTAADYFSLGNLKDAYVGISLHVAQYEEYQTAIIEHLYRVKLSHWDPSIRLLASLSLNKLTPVNPGFMANFVIPHLLEKCLDNRNLQLRHGATLGLAEVVRAFGDMKVEQSYLTESTQTAIAEIVPIIEKKRLYRGKGGEQMRAAVCRLIECIAVSRMTLKVSQQVRLLDSVDACLVHPNETIQLQAGAALHALTRSYFPVSSNGPSPRLQNRVVDKYAKIIRTDLNPGATRGFSLALGCLPSKLLAPSSTILDISLSCLCRASSPRAKVGTEKDAETRKNALVSLSQICKTVGVIPAREQSECVVGFSENQLNLVLSAFIRAMGDYNTDQRGDVGSKCRIAAMNGLVGFATIVSAQKHPEGSDFFSKDMCSQIIGLLLKQFSEKLNFVRSEAAKCLISLLDDHSPVKPYIVAREMLLEALTPPNYAGKLTYESIDWTDATITYSMVMKAAESEEYFEYIITGLVISTGGLTKVITENSARVLIKWIRDSDIVNLKRFGDVLLNIFKTHQHEGRVILPLLKTIDMLMNRGCLEQLINGSLFPQALLQSLREESKICRDINRLTAILSVSTGLIISCDTSKEFIRFVCEFLVHKFPRIRSTAAEKLYVRLLETDPELGNEHRGVKLLLELNWEADASNAGSIDTTRAIEEIVESFGIKGSNLG